MITGECLGNSRREGVRRIPPEVILGFVPLCIFLEDETIDCIVSMTMRWPNQDTRQANPPDIWMSRGNGTYAMAQYSSASEDPTEVPDGS